MNPADQLPMMKRLDEVDIFKDFALTHNMNWGLIMTDHFFMAEGWFIKFNYEEGLITHPVICHPEQRIAVPSRTNPGGFAWAAAKELNPGDPVMYIKALVQQEKFTKVVKVTDYDIVWLNEMVYTLTVANENTFIIHDLLTHRNLSTVPVSQEAVFS